MTTADSSSLTVHEDARIPSLRARLAGLEAQVVERELELAELNAELAEFDRLCAVSLAARYAERDLLQAAILEAAAAKRPHYEPAQREAEAARERAEASAKANEDQQKAGEKAPRPKPTAGLKSMFRECVKRYHPDRADDDADRERRTELMIKVNLAYENGDEAALQALLSGLGGYDSPESSLSGEALVLHLQRVIERSEERLASLAEAIRELRESEPFAFMTAHEQAVSEGRNLIDELASELDRQIEQLREQAAALGVD